MCCVGSQNPLCNARFAQCQKMLTRFSKFRPNTVCHLLNIFPLLRGPGQRSWYNDWLRARRSGDRIPMAVRFSTPVQTGPGAHLAFCTMSTASYPGVKTAVPSPPSSAIGYERVELYLYSPCGPYGLYRASVPVQG